MSFLIFFVVWLLAGWLVLRWWGASDPEGRITMPLLVGSILLSLPFLALAFCWAGIWALWSHFRRPSA